MRIQIEDQVVERVRVVVTHHGLVRPAVPVAQGMNVLKELDLPNPLAKYEHLSH